MLGEPRSDWEWVRDRVLIAYGRDDPEFVPGVLEEPELGALAVIRAVQDSRVHAGTERVQAIPSR